VKVEESLKKELFPESLDEAIDQFEQGLGLPKNFYHDLIKQDDWSFVIKTHALLEALLTQVISITVGKPELDKILGKLTFANTSTGKLAFAKELALIGDIDMNYLRTLTKIRNNFVHNISSVANSLESEISKLSLSEKLSIIKMTNPDWTPEKETTFKIFLDGAPKQVISWATLGVLSNVLAEKGKKELEREKASIDKQVGEVAKKIVDALGLVKSDLFKKP